MPTSDDLIRSLAVRYAQPGVPARVAEIGSLKRMIVLDAVLLIGLALYGNAVCDQIAGVQDYKVARRQS